MAATWTLCTGPEDDEIAAKLVELMCAAPKAGKGGEEARARLKKLSEEVDAALDTKSADPAQAEFAQHFTARGQQRSNEYEPPIAKRLGKELSKGLRVRGALKPDFILEEYEPCAVTRASSTDGKAIELAIKRGCHVIELTVHLQEDMRGLDAYLAEKVRVYAELLESV